jgi:hypothetical protein
MVAARIMKTHIKPLIIVHGALMLAGCSSSAPKEDAMMEAFLSGRAPRTLTAEQMREIQKHPLGTKENPVRVEGVEGEYRYLARLRCPEGKPPIVDRAGSAGDMSPYGSIMDIYDVVCDAPPKHTVFVDMYHPGHVETAAIPGFTIVAP